MMGNGQGDDVEVRLTWAALRRGDQIQQNERIPHRGKPAVA